MKMTIDYEMLKSNSVHFRKETQDPDGEYQKKIKEVASDHPEDLYQPVTVECQECDRQERYLKSGDAISAGWRHVVKIDIADRLNPTRGGYSLGTNHVGYCPECR